MSEKRKGEPLWPHLFSTKTTYSFNVDDETAEQWEGEFEGVPYEISVDSDDGLLYVLYHGEGWYVDSEGPFRTLREAHQQARYTIFQVVVE